MRHLKDDDEDVYKRQFSHFLKEGIEADTVSLALSFAFVKMTGYVLSAGANV